MLGREFAKGVRKTKQRSWGKLQIAKAKETEIKKSGGTQQSEKAKEGDLARISHSEKPRNLHREKKKVGVGYKAVW